MKDMVKLSMQSVKRKINSKDRKFCFELFGYDFIIDELFRAWLIEVNTNPCLEESSKLLQMLLPRLIDDALKLTIDVIFPRKRRGDGWLRPEIEINYKVNGYNNYENMWEQIDDISLPVRRGKVKNIFKAGDFLFTNTES